MIEGEQDQWFVDRVRALNCDVKVIPHANQHALCVKPTLHRHSPYELTMFLDADTLVIAKAKIDEYFEMIRRNGFVTGNFCNWKTMGSSMSKRIKAWKPAVPELIKPALNYGTAVNTGVNGWKKGNPLLEEWDTVCQKGYAQKCTTRIVDEIACQLVLPHFSHKLAGPDWGASVKFWEITKETKIIHYHGHKHAGPYPNCKYWKDMYWEMRQSGVLDKEHAHFHDKSVKKWLKEGEKEMA